MLAAVHGGVIHHGDEHGSHATSYQHVKIENYHAVPVFVKKEHSELLEHPVSAGHVNHGVEVHHGDGHHDPGYAIPSEHQHEGHEDGKKAFISYSILLFLFVKKWSFSFFRL